MRFKDGGGERWISRTEALLRDVPGLTGAVLNVAGDAIGVEGRTPELALGFDGCAEYWFEDRTALIRALATPAWRAAKEGIGVGRRGTRGAVGGDAGASGEGGDTCTRSSGW